MHSGEVITAILIDFTQTVATPERAFLESW